MADWTVVIWPLGGSRGKKRISNLMEQASKVGELSTCDRGYVGCLILQGKRIIASSYNGAPSGMDHCDDVGHDIEHSHCVRVNHAEENAIIQCALNGVSTKGAWVVCSLQPCVRCAKMLFSAGIRSVVFRDRYGTLSEEDKPRIKALCDKGLKLYRIDTEGNLIDASHNVDYALNPNRNSPSPTQLY